RVEPTLHLAERKLHVGARAEVEAQLGPAAHRAGTNSAQVHDSANGLLQRARHRDRHLLGLERAAPRDYGNPRIRDLGIDAGGQGCERPDPAGSQETDAEIESSAVAKRESGEAHRLRAPEGATRMPSCRPKAPVVTI